MKTKMLLVGIFVLLFFLSGCLNDFVTSNSTILIQKPGLDSVPFASMYFSNQNIRRPTSVSVIDGTITSGTVNDVNTVNMVYLVVNETGSWRIDFNFGNMQNIPTRVKVVGFYDANPNREVKIYGWNYVTNSWIAFTSNATDFPNASGNKVYFFNYGENRVDFVKDGKAAIEIRLLSSPNDNYDFYVDQIVIDEETIRFSQAGVFYDLNGFLDYESNGLDANIETGEITVFENGDYVVLMDSSFSGSPNSIVHIHCFKNDVYLDELGMRRQLGVEGDVGSAATSSILSLKKGDKLKVKIENDVLDSFVTVQHFGFNVFKVSD